MNRHLLDGWMRNVEQLSRRACFYMSEKSQEEEILRLHRDMGCWRHMTEVEERVDQLNLALRNVGQERQAAPAGI